MRILEKEEIIKALGDTPYDSIILFGSRARGDNRDGSDYDILLIVPKNITIPEKFRIKKIVRTHLAKNGIDIDILVKSREEVDMYKNTIGSIIKEALSEGVEI